MKEYLKNIPTKYPVYFKLVVFQLTAVLLGSAVLFILYHHISGFFFDRAFDENKAAMHRKIDKVQEQWRTWKYMSLNDALNPALEEFKDAFQLESIAVIDIVDLPKKWDRYDIIIPEATDPVINYVVYARLSPLNVGYLYKMHRLFLSVLLASFVLTLAVIWFASLMLFRWYYLPIGQLNEAVANLNAGDRLKIDHIRAYDALGSFISHLKQMTHYIRGYERMSSIGKMSSQIVCVLKPYFNDLKGLTEIEGAWSGADRQKMNHAVRGIENVLNDLNEKSRRVNESLGSLQDESLNINGASQEEFTAQLLFSVLDTLVSEKRMQFHSLSHLRLDLVSAKHAYGLFVNIKTLVFRKLVSNIIDLFAEQAGRKENIVLKIEGDYHHARLTISDDVMADFENEYLDKRSPEQSFLQKFDPSSHLDKARLVFQAWGGDLAITIIENRATLVSVDLPRQPHQNWLLSHLELERYSHVVILDDDKAIHLHWENILIQAEIKPSHIIHFYKPEEFIQWFVSERKHQELRSGYDTLLTAYEFVGSDKTGIDVIEEFNLKGRSILVTSQYKRQRVLKLCEGMDLKILPKALVGTVPIIVSDIVEKPDCILIAQDEHVQVYWRMEARLSGKTILTYNGPEDFYRYIHNYDRSVPIYITTILSGEVRGIDFSRELDKLGFKNIYITTGRDKTQFPAMPWIRGIVTKEPPWKYH
ncbi:MAG TPA: hypothetical protein VJC18_12065 [bacterium]|nr:hypothetical protein [bacterium]